MFSDTLYFLTIIGVWKMLGAIAILVPRFPRLKEWAYAGIFFNVTARLHHIGRLATTALTRFTSSSTSSLPFSCSYRGRFDRKPVTSGTSLSPRRRPANWPPKGAN